MANHVKLLDIQTAKSWQSKDVVGVAITSSNTVKVSDAGTPFTCQLSNQEDRDHISSTEQIVLENTTISQQQMNFQPVTVF